MRVIRDVLSMLVVMVLILFVGDAMAQYGFKFDTAESMLMGANKKIFDFAKNVFSVALFFVGFWYYIDGYFKKDLANRWYLIIGIGIFLVILNSFPLLFGIFSSAAGGPAKPF